MTSRLYYFSVEELTKVIDRSAGLIGVTINKEGAGEIAARSPGTPRISNNLLRWGRDYAPVKADGAIDKNVADLAFKMVDIDNHGLDEMDKRLLEAFITR